MRLNYGNLSIPIRQLPDGRWRASFNDSTGKRRHITGALETVKAKAEIAVVKLSATRSLEVPEDELEAFRLWRAKKQSGPPIEDVAAEFLASQALRERRTERTRNEQRRLVERIIRDLVGVRMGEITTAQLEAIVHGNQAHAARTRHHIRAQIVQVWRFAKDRGHLPLDNAAAERVPKISFVAGQREILSPAEMRAVIGAVADHYLPFVLLSAFAGIRHQELRPDSRSHKRPVGWQDIRLDERIIIIEADSAKSKRGRRRIIPIPANLASWLESLDAASRIGAVCPHRPFTERESRRVAAAVGLDHWPHNCLRHSYGSYRMAVCRDAARVSEEMGNSAQDVRQHYDAVVSEVAGAEFWSIAPVDLKNHNRETSAPKSR